MATARMPGAGPAEHITAEVATRGDGCPRRMAGVRPDAVLAAGLDRLEFSPVHATPQALLYASFRALGEALQSGNLNAVQSVWRALAQVMQTASPGRICPLASGATLAHLAEAMRLLQQCANNGDIAGARQAYATLGQLLADVRAGTPQRLLNDTLRALGVALQSGDIRAIQSAWRALARVMQTESLAHLASGTTLVRLAEAMRLLQDSMQNGDLAGAQLAYATVRGLLWGERSSTPRDQLETSFLAFAKSLQSGNIKSVRSTWSALEQAMQTASPTRMRKFAEGVNPALFTRALRALQQSVQSGNLVGAQQAYVALRQLLRSASSSTPRQAAEHVRYNDCHPRDRWTGPDVPIYRAARGDMSTPIIPGIGPAERVAADVAKLRSELQQLGSSVRPDSVPAAALDLIELSPVHPTPQGLLYDSFRALGEALQSGNTKTAQSAWRALAQVMQAASLGHASQLATGATLAHLAEAVRTLRQSVQSGDIPGAQQAYASIRQLLRNARLNTPQHLSGNNAADDVDEPAAPRTDKQPSALQAYWMAQMDGDNEMSAAALSRQPRSVKGEDYDLYLLLAATRLPAPAAEPNVADDADRGSSLRTRSLLWWLGVNLAAVLCCVLMGLFQFTVASAIPLLVALGALNLLLLLVLRFSGKN